MSSSSSDLVLLPSRRDFVRTASRTRVPTTMEREMVMQAKLRSAQLESARDRELQDLVAALRESAERFGSEMPSQSHKRQWIAGAAVVREAIRRTCGLRYHSAQLLAGLAQSNGYLVEMANGEGKTIVSAIPAFLAWLNGRKTHVATCNSYLAKRDWQQLRPAFEMLGMTAALLPGRSDPRSKSLGNRSDVVYGTGDAFCLNYLRDRLRVRTSPRTDLDAAMRTLQLRMQWMVVDEIDTVLMDKAITPLILKQQNNHLVRDRSPRNESRQVVEELCGDAETREDTSSLQITRQRFFQLYDSICGMTGTVNNSDIEFDEMFGLRTVLIPRRRPCRRVDLPDRFFSSKDAKFRAIIVEVLERHRCGQPVLIGTKTIADSGLLSMMLRSLKLNHEVLDGRQDAEEAANLARAGHFGAVTIATDMAGRGTDIKPDNRALAVGGLFVIGTERHDSRRLDRQLAGRTGRQGDFGFSRFFVSGDDDLLQRYAPKLSKRLRKNADKNGEVHDNYSPLVTQFQLLAERQSFKHRRQMVEHDRKLDELLACVDVANE